MNYKISKKLIKTQYRKEMWKNARRAVAEIEKVLPIKAAYILGSFTTTKTRPADVDFMVFLKTREKNKKSKWAIDLTIVPDNNYGRLVLKDADKWVKEKYGQKDSTTVRIK